MDILVDADSDRDSHFLPTACDFRSLCPIVPNLGYIPWVFSEGCAGDLNWMSAYKASLDSAVKAHRILHQGTREKTEVQEEKPTPGNTAPFFTNVRPGGDDVLRTEKQRVHDISTWAYSLLTRLSVEELWVAFLACSQGGYTLLDVDANFGLKMRMSEQSWTKICLITANTIKIWQEHRAIKHFRLK